MTVLSSNALSRAAPPGFLAGRCLPLGFTASGRRVGMDAEDMVRHALVVGSTGSGKTELLLNMAHACISRGGGVVFVDGKGDLSNWSRIVESCRLAARLEDALLVNMGPTGRNGRPQPTHGWDVFDGLSENEVGDILVSTLPPPSGDHAFWRQRGAALGRLAVRLAFARAGRGEAPRVTPRLVFGCMELPLIFEEAGKPGPAGAAAQAYLNTLPGYNPAKKLSEHYGTVRDQHGYLAMQWTALSAMFRDVFPAVFPEGPCDLSLRDAVLRRRVVHLSLPTLHRDKSEVAALGTLAFAGVRSAMVALMPEPGDVRSDLPPGALPPTLVILDEVGHYLCGGMGVMAAQARSLGVSMVFATQSLEAMESRDREESSLVVANCNTRIVMRQAAPPGRGMSNILPEQRMGELTEGAAERERGQRELEELEAHLSVLRDARDGREARTPEQLRLLDKKVAVRRDHGHARAARADWSLSRVVGSLAPGEFIAIQGSTFLVARAPLLAPPAPPAVPFPIPSTGSGCFPLPPALPMPMPPLSRMDDERRAELLRALAALDGDDPGPALRRFEQEPEPSPPPKPAPLPERVAGMEAFQAWAATRGKGGEEQVKGETIP